MAATTPSVVSGSVDSNGAMMDEADQPPPLEHAPLIQPSSTATAASGSSGQERRGIKREREGSDDTEQKEGPSVSGYDDSVSDDDDEGDGGGYGSEELEMSVEDLLSGSRQRRVKPPRPKDEHGVARPQFPVIQALHASAYLGRAVDVKTIARQATNAVYKPPSCVRISLRSPAGIAQIYSSGKFILMGGRSTIDMIWMARKAARKVQKIPEFKDVGIHNFSLNNISAHASLGYRVDLNSVASEPALEDYVDYESQQWAGLHYRLPVDPTKSMADLIPSLAAARRIQNGLGEQHSTEEFLGIGQHALTTKPGELSYYATTGTSGSRNVNAKGTPIRLPPSLYGQILTATIYSSGRMTLTGIRKEKDLHTCFERLWHILRPYAVTIHPQTRQPLPLPNAPPLPPPYPKIILPSDRRAAREAMRERRRAAIAMALRPTHDIKPNVAAMQSTTPTLPPPSADENRRVLVGSMRKVDTSSSSSSSSTEDQTRREAEALAAQVAAAAASSFTATQPSQPSSTAASSSIPTAASIPTTTTSAPSSSATLPVKSEPGTSLAATALKTEPTLSASIAPPPPATTTAAAEEEEEEVEWE